MVPKTSHIDNEKLQHWLEEVRDPEIPVLNIVEMGILREVETGPRGIIVYITPTYSGCPAMSAIEESIKSKMREKGIEQVTVKKDFSASWTTEWMTDEARQKLKEYGIAPPEHRNATDTSIPLSEKTVSCPQCDSDRTTLQSEFGSTACKALFYCHNCEEAFEHFKCH